jgi:uncharacterized DUF497 family protein
MELTIDLDLSKVEGFDWDKGNLNKNRLKHNVDPTECEEVFFNKPIIIFDDKPHSTTEEKRYRILGISTNGRKIALAITTRNNKIRVIMARDQSIVERGLFETEKVNKIK